MLKNIMIGLLMMVVTTAIHAGFTVVTLKRLRLFLQHHDVASQWSRFYVMGSAVLWMFAGSLVEVGLWAWVFVMLGAIAGAEPALYFSTVTFTTLGYGDVVLDPQWRLLASFEAATGIIMFGWTTAVVLAVVQRVYAQGTSTKDGDGQG